MNDKFFDGAAVSYSLPAAGRKLRLETLPGAIDALALTSIARKAKEAGRMAFVV